MTLSFYFALTLAGCGSSARNGSWPTGWDGNTIRRWFKSPEPGQSKTWVLYGRTNQGQLCGKQLYRLVGHGKKKFRWRLPKGNPYLRVEARNTITSPFPEVAMAFANA